MRSFEDVAKDLQQQLVAIEVAQGALVRVVMDDAEELTYVTDPVAYARLEADRLRACAALKMLR